MVIGLMGFELNSPNKGCEALGYSFISLLRKINLKNIKFIVFTNDDLGIFPKYFCEFEFIKIPLKIKDISFKMIKALKACDYIFDVTLGDSFSDIYSLNQCLSNIRFKTLAEMFGKNYILLPQTYGPFNDKKCRKCSLRILNHASYIFFRDKKSLDYIQTLGLGNANIKLVTDMAFSLPYDKTLYSFESHNIKIGINVSGLLWKGGFESENQFGLTFDYKQFIYSILDYFIAQRNVDIFLIPHVVDATPVARDDDSRYLKVILKNYPTVNIAPDFESPIDAKSFIASMDFFIGSRMHATIAAFSCGVPTIPVSYSRKFEGLYEAMNYDYIIHGKGETLENAKDNVVNWFEKREHVKKYIMECNVIIAQNIQSFEQELKKIFRLEG